MSYPGNASLAQDVQDRITNTFQQTLDLVTQGKEQEARVGCEFILRMDPAFSPAQALMTRLSSPQRPIVIGDLRDGQVPGAPQPGAPQPGAPQPGAPQPGAPQPAATQQAAAPEDFPELDDPLDDLGDLGSLDDLEDLDGPEGAASPVSPASGPAPPATGLAAVVEDLVQKRNFQQVLQIAENQKDAVAKDGQVRKLVESARSRLESDAYVKAFVKSARQAQAAGQLDAMESHLAKARTLDPEHPDILAFQQRPQVADPAAVAPPEAPSPPPSFAPTPESRSPPPPPPPPPPVADDPFAELPPGPELEIAADGEPELPDLTFESDVPEAGGDPQDAAPSFAASPAAAPTAAEPAATEPQRAPAPTASQDDGEGGDRIAELLQEGQEIFERGDYQAAIDVWSRIFLIDIDNGEASRRIEAARKKKSELERQAEELFHEGTELIQKGSLDEAKETLRRVLELQPNHSLANEYLEQLEAGQVPAVTRAGESDPLSEFEALDPDALIAGNESGPSMEAAVERDRIVVVRRADRKLIVFGGLVSVAVIAGAYLLYSKWDDYFPNREAPAPVVRVDPIERATKMHEAGNTENAIILLSRIQPQDPIHGDAQELIEAWKASAETEAEEVPAGPSEDQVRRYDLLIGAAREAHGRQQFIRARKYIELASKISPLDAESLLLKRSSDEALQDLEAEIEQFDDGEYAQVIPNLWRKREKDPQNPDIQLLLINSYYNLALTDLQRGDPLGAAKKLQEALEVEPGNAELERMKLFAQTYVDRPQDLLYRIYVKYLPSRS